MNVNFQHDSIWGHDPSTWEGIDRPASEAKLIELVNERFESFSIDAELTISNSTQSVISDHNEDEENHAVGIADDVWGQHDWYIDLVTI